MRRMPELELAVSATTRERRPTERDGREYHFVSEDEFDHVVVNDDLNRAVDELEEIVNKELRAAGSMAGS